MASLLTEQRAESWIEHIHVPLDIKYYHIQTAEVTPAIAYTVAICSACTVPQHEKNSRASTLHILGKALDNCIAKSTVAPKSGPSLIDRHRSAGDPSRQYRTRGQETDVKTFKKEI